MTRGEVSKKNARDQYFLLIEMINRLFVRKNDGCKRRLQRLMELKGERKK